MRWPWTKAEPRAPAYERALQKRSGLKPSLVVTFVPTNNRTGKDYPDMAKQNKEHRETFRLTSTELARLEFVAKWRTGGNRSDYLRRIVEEHFYAYFGNEWWGENLSPHLVRCMVERAHRKTVVPGVESEYARAWLAHLDETTREIARVGIFAPEAKAKHKACMKAYPAEFMREIHEEAAALALQHMEKSHE